MANSTSTISNTVSTFIDSQLPQFIRDNDPNFGTFIKAYYEWMETSNNSGIIAQSKSLLSYNDIDSTTDQFIQYFINDFLPYFPNDVALDERKLIKVARNFYQKKGSVESVQFLFRVLYNKEADIYFPKNQVLKCSDGKWYLPQAIRILLSAGNENFDINLLVGRQGLGSESNASCTIESATKTVDQGLGIELIELYVSDVNQIFSDLENLNIVYGYDANNNPLIFSEKIIAALSNIVINPHYRGTLYKGYSESPFYNGDPVSVIGGLEPNDPQAQKAVAYVNSVTTGSVSGANVLFGGYAYRLDPNTQVQVITAPGDKGTGATVIVQAIDSANAVYMKVDVDSIEYQGSTYLNAASYLFANNLGYVNANIAIANALTWQNLQFAPITFMNVTNGGGGYSTVPTLNLEVLYYTDYVTNLVNGGANTTTIQQNMQYIDNLGVISNVVVEYGGTGYNNVTDQIVVPSSIGYGATFTFATSPVTNTITGVTVTNAGNGYIELPYNLAIVNSANVMNGSAGNGAILTAYGYGQGANIGLSVNEIGQIVDFRIVSRGFDYISTPNVSVRVADISLHTVVPPNVFAVDSQVYQGSSPTNTTWTANVDSYNAASSILRVYNYQGALNINANIIAPTFNATVNRSQTAIVTYGDGLAKANAIFQNGLISYPGFYLTTDGFLSAEQYLQDSNTYHNYSYVIVVEKALIEYKKILMQLVHPIGTSMLGSYSVITENPIQITPNGNVNILPVCAGTVSTGNSLILYGTGTNFGNVGNVGDIIIFNTSDTSQWQQAKIIKSVIDQNTVVLESNTLFAVEQVSITNGSNTITGINISSNVDINDIVAINTGTIVYSVVQSSTSQNTVTVNTVFATNLTNTLMMVYPSINNASYVIVEAAT